MNVFNMIRNSQGGVDWQALPLAAEMYGVTDIEGTIRRVLVIRDHPATK